MSLNRKDSTDEIDAATLPTLTFPIKGIGLRCYWARRDVCPECGDDLDTGWECTGCGYDAQPEAYPGDAPKPAPAVKGGMTVPEIIQEWQRGCTNTQYPRVPAWRCRECTLGMVRAVLLRLWDVVMRKGAS